MKLIDLSMSLWQGMPKFWGEYHAPYQEETTGTYEVNKCQVRRISMATHSATHIDAPAHFVPGGQTIDNVSLDSLVSRVVVLDASPIAPRGRITLEQCKGLDVDESKGVLIRTGWDKRWPLGTYFGADIPALDLDAAQYLASRGCKSLAVDFPLGIDIHTFWLGDGRILIENLVGLERITQKEPWLIALPLKVKDGDGAPARVVVAECD